ncbi:hypothetical protein [Deinococcus sp. YIM 77859]|uniref:hypothetical protein n=1 Tax=Deinococcus sp. YIM 77859 TaxID=1540221 RepID=UPI0012E085AA|nr:hypothetical protein [Deinococcus sp. YIM 77859]
MALLLGYAVRDGVVEFLEVKTEPGTTDPRDAANAAVGEAFGQKAVHFGLCFRRTAVPGGLRDELVPASTTKVALLAGVGMSVFDDANAVAPGANWAVHSP